MSLGDLSSEMAVRAAVEEFDDLGRDGFLEKYGFGKAQGYFLRVEGTEYDSKAIVAAAHGVQFPDAGPLVASEFSGGEKTVATKLEALGFEVVKPRGKNPAWATDELVLALDLYLREGLLDSGDLQVIELSRLLNSLPIHTTRPDAEKFRNPNGVALKLANFAALDPSHSGVGMKSVGKGDKEVWERFGSNADALHDLAGQIRSGASTGFPELPEEDEGSVKEGRLLFRRHRIRERDRSVVKKKKAQVLKATGHLACEGCGFDFEAAYGELGEGFIECHHTVPLAESGSTKTSLAQLSLLCSNCHRMVHRARPFLSIDDLKKIVNAPQ